MDITEIPAEMTDAALWAIILGFIQPLVLNFILQSGWSARTQALVAFVFSAIVGTVTAVIAGAFSGLSIVTTILLVAVVSITAYQGFWRKVTPKLKEQTSVDK